MLKIITQKNHPVNTPFDDLIALATFKKWIAKDLIELEGSKMTMGILLFQKDTHIKRL